MPVELLVADEPLAAGFAFDAWEIHPEVFDCGGPGPVNTEGSGEGGGEGVEGSGNDTAEGSGTNALALNQTYEATCNGARLVMRYDEANNRFVGKVVNMTNATLTRVRVEIHLSNGVELGPTTPTDLPAGYQLSLTMPATDQPFDAGRLMRSLGKAKLAVKALTMKAPANMVAVAAAKAAVNTAEAKAAAVEPAQAKDSPALEESQSTPTLRRIVEWTGCA